MKTFAWILYIALSIPAALSASDRCREYYHEGNQFMCAIDPCCDRNKLQNGNTWTKQGNKYVKNHRWTCSANTLGMCQASRSKTAQNSTQAKASIADLITSKDEGIKKLSQIESTCSNITDELAELFSLKEEIQTVYINAQYDKSAYIFVDNKKQSSQALKMVQSLKDSQLFNLRCRKDSEQSFSKLQNATQTNKQIANRFLETCFNSNTSSSVDSIQKNILEQRPAVAIIFGSTDFFGSNPKKTIQKIKNELGGQTRIVYYPEPLNSGKIQTIDESMNGLNDFVVTNSALKAKKGELDAAWKFKNAEYENCLRTQGEVSKKVKSFK